MSSLLLLKSLLFAEALKKSNKLKKRKRKRSSGGLINYDRCRVCNQKHANIPIFMNVRYPNIANEIQNISGVIITATDQFSKHICKACMKLLNGCILFRELCQKNNQKLELSVKGFRNGSCQIKKHQNKINDDVHCLTKKYKKENKNNNDSSYKCLDENETRYEDYSDDDSYDIPSPLLNDDEIWSCTNCVKVFDNLESYNQHLKECHTINSLKSSRELGKKVFLCDTCGKTTSSNANLLTHMSTHANVFPFKCDICPYQGRTLELLRIHKRSHLKDKPYKCPHCPKATSTSSNLIKHIRHVHSTSRPFKCLYCQKAFPFRHILNKHVNDIHLKQGTAECDICFKKFSTRKILYGHRVKIHKLKTERTGRLPAYLQYEMDKNLETVTQDTE